MKIAVNCRLLVPNKMDGIARFSYEILQRITRNHPEVEFTFIFDRKVDEKAFQFASNVKVVSLPPQARIHILWAIWFEVVLRNYINKKKFDLFISPEGWVPGGLKCKSLSVIHDLNFEHHPEHIIYSHRKYLQYFFPKYARRADKIITVSEYSRDDIAKTYQLVKEEIDIVYNGADSIFKPISQEDAKKIKAEYSGGKDYFIFIGTLHPRKNLKHLFLGFEAYKKISNSSLKLLIVGNRKWWPSNLERLYQGLKHKTDIIFVGRLSDQELAKVLASATALTYLPYFEGFGIPILEAFQAGTAVITSDVTSMPEIAAGAAELCGVEAIEQIAEAMKRVVEDDDYRLKLIEKGLARAKDFSWDDSAVIFWKSVAKIIE